jgi:hypothetical protein
MLVPDVLFNPGNGFEERPDVPEGDARTPHKSLDEIANRGYEILPDAVGMHLAHLLKLHHSNFKLAFPDLWLRLSAKSVL